MGRRALLSREASVSPETRTTSRSSRASSGASPPGSRRRASPNGRESRSARKSISHPRGRRIAAPARPFGFRRQPGPVVLKVGPDERQVGLADAGAVVVVEEGQQSVTAAADDRPRLVQERAGKDDRSAGRRAIGARAEFG